jgi:hypothetical protein
LRGTDIVCDVSISRAGKLRFEWDSYGAIWEDINFERTCRLSQNARAPFLNAVKTPSWLIGSITASIQVIIVYDTTRNPETGASFKWEASASLWEDYRMSFCRPSQTPRHRNILHTPAKQASLLVTTKGPITGCTLEGKKSPATLVALKVWVSAGQLRRHLEEYLRELADYHQPRHPVMFLTTSAKTLVGDVGWKQSTNTGYTPRRKRHQRDFFIQY